MPENIDNIILENKSRRAKMLAPYNPGTGLGSPLERIKVDFFHANVHYVTYFPKEMYDEMPGLRKLKLEGSVEKTVGTDDLLVTQAFVNDLNKSRFKYDFEFWAFVCARIQDKVTKKEIPFVLNRPQRRVLSRYEKKRLAGKPIRVIVLKARQWGGSTLTQVYMAWMQIIIKTNWHSAIIADVDDQSRNIRGMYKRLARLYPKQFGTITFIPYEGSSKTKVIKERNCIVGVGSAQEPDSLRSYDFSMLHLCLAPGTLIPTENGFLKKVEELSLSDHVITHTGEKTTIKAVTKSKPTINNGNGKAISITSWLGQEITMTPNHPVWTNRGWIEAGKLQSSDLLSMPIRKITKEIIEIKLPYSPMRKRGGGKRPAFNGGTISLDQEIGFAFGYYLAEGSLHNGNVGKTQITFTRNDNEFQFSDRAIKALLPFISSHFRRKRENTLTTHEHLYGTVLARWIDAELGIKETKRIPDWFFQCGEDFLKGVLQGYLSGDGSKQNGSQGKYIITQISATTVSSSLAMQIRDIAASLGLGWGAIDIREAGDWYGRNCKKTYILRWAGISAKNIKSLLGWSIPDNGRPRSEKTFIRDGFIWMKIRAIKKTKVAEVYDIEVEHKDHSFRTMSFSVKNSEVGIWKSTPQRSAEDLVQSIRSTVPTISDSLIVMESTAKGVGNFFHREWQAAKKGTSSYDPVFVPWFEIERYQNSIKDYDAFIKWMGTETYARYLWTVGATLEGIKWYYDTKNGENYDDWRMKSEYPSNDTEAFQSTGRTVFNPEYVANARKTCTKPEFIGELVADAQTGKDSLKNIKFKDNARGNLWIWSMPDLTEMIAYRYALFGDIGGRTELADYSVLRVIDRYWMMDGGKPEIVATWWGHVDQDIFAWIAAQVGMFYGMGLLAIETNSLRTRKATEGDHFITILDEIAPHYPNLFARTDPEKIRMKVPIKWGFHTNSGTKSLIINTLNAALRESSYVEKDERACDELDTLEYKIDGSIGAVDGSKDDLAITTAGVVWLALKYLPLPVVSKPFTTNKDIIISEASFG